MSIELFHIIGDMSIYRTYIIKFVIYKHNSNILGLGKEKVHLNSHFSLIKKIIIIIIKTLLPPYLVAFPCQGASGHGLNGLCLGSALHREAFVFVRSSTTEKFLFVVGGECYFNMGSAFFFFLMNVRSVLGYQECFFFFLDRNFFSQQKCGQIIDRACVFYYQVFLFYLNF